MITTAIVLAALNAQPACYRDRQVAPEVKAEQYAWIAEAIALAAGATKRPDERAAYLLTIGWHESRWCLDVHAGKRRTGYAHGLWQLEGRDKQGRGPLEGLSREATINAARVASEVIQRSWQCGPSPGARITAYAGRPCELARAGWPTLQSRINGFWWALSLVRGRTPRN